MPATAPLVPEVDFAYEELPDLHEVLDQLRQQGPVVPVTYHKGTTWLINSYAELKQAFPDEVHFEAAAAYRIHSEPSMGKTIQTMSGDEHRVNRALVQEALRWQPPTALLPRMCSADTELGGVALKAGDWVLFGITAANSDPDMFPNPGSSTRCVTTKTWLSATVSTSASVPTWPPPGTGNRVGTGAATFPRDDPGRG